MRRLLFACLLASTVPGCQKTDTETLARLGRKLADRAQGTCAEVCAKLDLTWKMPVLEPSLDERVRLRLRYDSELSGLEFDVKGTAGQIDLAGKVAKEEQRRKAVALAEGTAGVEKVTDAIVVEAPIPEPPPVVPEPMPPITPPMMPPTPPPSVEPPPMLEPPTDEE